VDIFRKNDGPVQVRGELHISEAQELRSALIGELAAVSRLVLDLSEVDSCDTASLQLLCSLQKSAQCDGKELRLLAPSAAIHNATSVLGLSIEDLTSIPNAGREHFPEVL
jgi:anti-anti-sigma factor